MINIKHVVQETDDFAAVIRRLIRDLAALQYNEAIETESDRERVARYAVMMADLRILDDQAIRVGLGVKEVTEGLGRISDQLQRMAGNEPLSTIWAGEEDFKQGPVDEAIPRE